MAVAVVLFVREALPWLNEQARLLQSSMNEPAAGSGAGVKQVPDLERAKRAIPRNLDAIYKALDNGNPMAARGLIAEQVLSNYEKLDYICKPYTLRSHYIEAIIERPGGLFEVRTRVLFQPLEERAYVLLFRAVQTQFVLEGVADPDDDWFGAEKQAATELARNFVYAAQARKAEQLTPLVVPTIAAEPFVSDTCWQQFFYNTKEPQVRSVNLMSYKGLKAEVVVDLNPATGFGFSAIGTSRFMVDRVRGKFQIVSADPRGDYYNLYLPDAQCPDKNVLRKVEDPDLEDETLTRFGLAKTN